jgi:hypothetical protein
MMMKESSMINFSFADLFRCQKETDFPRKTPLLLILKISIEQQANYPHELQRNECIKNKYKSQSFLRNMLVGKVKGQLTEKQTEKE